MLVSQGLASAATNKGRRELPSADRCLEDASALLQVWVVGDVAAAAAGAVTLLSGRPRGGRPTPLADSSRRFA